MQPQNCYLDVTFNTDDDMYKRNKKPNNEIKCIHVDSNDPLSSIKQNPKLIMMRYASFSLPKEAFRTAPPHCEQNLASCG